MIFGLFGGNKPAESPEQLGYEPNEATQYLMDYLQNGSKFSSSNEDAQDGVRTRAEIISRRS